MNLRKHPIFLMLRKIKQEAVDLYKMQKYYGVLGRLISGLNLLPFFYSRSFPQRLYKSDKNGGVLRSEEPKADSNEGTAPEYPKISIITAILNQDEELDTCFTSVFGQNYPNLEYIVIDCGSTDNSIDIIKQHYKKIDFWCSKNFSSKAMAINEGFRHVNGEIFNWLEPEDRLEPGALFNCARAFQKNRYSGAWVGASLRLGTDGSGPVVTHPNGIERENLLLNWNGGQFGQASCFLNTQKTRDIGGFDEMWPYLYGLDLWIRLLEKWDFSTGKGIWSRTHLSQSPQTGFRTSEGSEWFHLQEKHGITAPKEPSRVSQGYTSPPSLQAHLDEVIQLNGAYHGFDRQRKIAVIAYSLPRFDKSSSEFRLHRIVQILLDSNCRVDFYYGVNTVEDERYKQSFNGQIEFYYLPHDPGNYVNALSSKHPDFIWISELWRIPFITFAVQMTREIKEKHTRLKIIADTIDFHYKEFYRKFEQSNQSDDLDLAQKYLNLENKLYRIADVVTVVSDEEKRDLQNHFEDVFQIEVVPNIHDLPVYSRPWSKRRNICFLGNFGTAHNADAVHYFLDHIFNRILEFNPTVEFHVLGFLAQKHRQDFKHPNVKVVGGLKNLQKALSCYRLFACPLTYGAGMKGKIGDAIIAGTPIVTTSIGAEGLPVKDGKELFIADSPIEFAEKCCQCISDPVTWHNFSLKAKLMIADNFSSNVVARQLQAILSSPGVGSV